MSKKHIDDCIRTTLEQYFKDLRGTEPHGVHEMILNAVERPMLEVVMKHADGNQSKAADWLGINRNTLRRKLLEHLHDHYALYGDWTGVRSARKHIGWAVRSLPGGEAFRAAMNTLETADAQARAVATFFDELADRHPMLPAANDEQTRLLA